MTPSIANTAQGMLVTRKLTRAVASVGKALPSSSSAIVVMVVVVTFVDHSTVGAVATLVKVIVIRKSRLMVGVMK
jgi:hypothetical protein